MEVIVFEQESYYKMVRELKQQIKEAVKDARTESVESAKKNKVRNNWISSDEAMDILGIRSKTTLQKYRDENNIKYSQSGRLIRYYKPSLYDFLETSTVH